MRITEIRIGGSVEVSCGQWRKVSITAEVSESDDVDVVSDTIGKKVDELLFPKCTTIKNISEANNDFVNTRDEIVYEIERCTDLKTLQSYSLLIERKYPELLEIYNQKNKQLKNGKSTNTTSRKSKV